MAKLSSFTAHNLTTTGTTMVLGADQGPIIAAAIAAAGTSFVGTNYIMVYGKGTPTDNAAELQAAYNAAKTMPRYLGSVGESFVGILKGQTFTETVDGLYLVAFRDFDALNDDQAANFATQLSTEAEAKSVRTTVIVAPGDYTFETPFQVDAEGIDIVSLTGNADILLSGINVTANDVYLKGLNCGTNAFNIDNNLDKLKCENCIGGDYSFGTDSNFCAGTFIKCVAGNNSFGGSEFSAGHVISGSTFINCIGGTGCFGGNGGYFIGEAINCIGGSDSFGGGDGELSGIVKYCQLTSGTFPTVSGNGHVLYCINGDNTPATNQ